MNFQTQLRNSNRLHKIYTNRLEKLGIFTFEDLLFHLPNRYEDYSIVSKISQVQSGEVVTIQGQILEFKNQYLRNARIRTIQKALVSDGTGSLEIIWFNQPFLAKSILANSTISASGRIKRSMQKLSMQSPEFEIILNNQTPLHTGRLISVYPETKGVSSKWLRRQIHTILNNYGNELPEYLPTKIINKFHFMNFQQALQEVHFPYSLDLAKKAKERLAFDELFLMQLAAIKRKKEWQQNISARPFTINKYQK